MAGEKTARFGSIHRNLRAQLPGDFFCRSSHFDRAEIHAYATGNVALSVMRRALQLGHRPRFLQLKEDFSLTPPSRKTPSSSPHRKRQHVRCHQYSTPLQHQRRRHPMQHDPSRFSPCLHRENDRRKHSDRKQQRGQRKK